jgi:hypothetical protein
MWGSKECNQWSMSLVIAGIVFQAKGSLREPFQSATGLVSDFNLLCGQKGLRKASVKS